MRHNIILLLLAFVCVFINCSGTSNDIYLPFEKNTVWYYDVKGFISLERYREQSSLPTGSGAIPERDTIEVFIAEIESLAVDSTLYRFNDSFVRFWGKEILRSEAGYQWFHGWPDPAYLLKFPIKLKGTWQNRFPYVFEECTIVSLDTVVAFDGHEYQNCLGIEVRQSREGEKHSIWISFSEEYGLVHYIDHDSEDEIRLLNMERL